ncbi:MAG TPA: hypothetical protein PLU11_08460, partial [Chitinophagaceae bacterium]|nr:hypothetical protein [Chitinophagaceae bacterium]
APSELYKPSSRTFDGNKMVFYFLQHRLSTLYYHKEKKEFRRIFNHLAYNHTVRLLGSGKLLIYRVLLFLPAGFLHQIKKVISRK